MTERLFIRNDETGEIKEVTDEPEFCTELQLLRIFCDEINVHGVGKQYSVEGLPICSLIYESDLGFDNYKFVTPAGEHME